MKKIMTGAELARLRKCSTSYICRLCRLPKKHPKHIQAVKINATTYMITDPAILAEYPGVYSASLE